LQDFNDYVNSANEKRQENNRLNQGVANGQGLASLISSIASQYNGKSEAELLHAIYKEAEKGKRNGTLSNEELDRFAKMLAPMLDGKKREKLALIIEKLKRI
jgi:hypothetical protein